MRIYVCIYIYNRNQQYCKTTTLQIKIRIFLKKDICTSMFTEALCTIAKTEKQSKCLSICEWMKKCVCACVCVHAHAMEYNSDTKRMK